VLDWSAREKPDHAARLDLIRKLLAARRDFVAALLPGMTGPGEAGFDAGLLRARWPAGGKTLMLLANLSDAAMPAPKDIGWGQPIWGDRPPGELPAWAVFAAIGGR
jgi:hypothetical protein